MPTMGRESEAGYENKTRSPIRSFEEVFAMAKSLTRSVGRSLK
jgi:hypothetical protein